MNYAVRTEQRDDLVAYLKESGIEPLTPLSLITPVHRHKALELNRWSLPMTDRLAKEFLYLPISPELTDEQAQYVISCIHRFYRSG
jgi:dTDP-4-amino-4,6-dideoxygalactose transaminase